MGEAFDKNKKQKTFYVRVQLTIYMKESLASDYLRHRREMDIFQHL